MLAALVGVAVALFLVFYLLWSVFLLYHLFRFAPQRETARAASLLFVAVSLFLFLLVGAFALRVNWGGLAPL